MRVHFYLSQDKIARISNLCKTFVIHVCVSQENQMCRPIAETLNNCHQHFFFKLHITYAQLNYTSARYYVII